MSGSPGRGVARCNWKPPYINDFVLRNPHGGNKPRNGVIKVSTVDVINLILLPGKVPSKVIHIFYGANLTALNKVGGGIRPVAVGLTLRRLTAKAIMAKLKHFCEIEFRPLQLGVCTPNGCEAAVHAVKTYVESPEVHDQILLKIDFSNAFNTVRRDLVLNLEKAP